MMRREKGRVHLDISEADFDSLLFALGLATSQVFLDGGLAALTNYMRLANRINEGNPDWDAYDV
jgi:hypothetical protein